MSLLDPSRPLGTGEPNEPGRPFVYLAGPDVFYPDAILRGARMKAALAARGMTGLFPLDGELHPGDYPSGTELALAIAEACEAQIRKADLGIFNIEPWRGPEADDGTAYELGFMAALGKPVVLYTSDPRPFAERIAADIYQGEVYRDGHLTRGKRDGMTIEAFDGFADNLMLINAAVRSARVLLGEGASPSMAVQRDFEAAADFASKLWERQKAQLK
ncbi:MAG: nucleoside 2-deoxyribosyltransferase [Rhodomicrobium sp.]